MMTSMIEMVIHDDNDDDDDDDTHSRDEPLWPLAAVILQVTRSRNISKLSDQDQTSNFIKLSNHLFPQFVFICNCASFI